MGGGGVIRAIFIRSLTLHHQATFCTLISLTLSHPNSGDLIIWPPLHRNVLDSQGRLTHLVIIKSFQKPSSPHRHHLITHLSRSVEPHLGLLYIAGRVGDIGWEDLKSGDRQNIKARRSPHPVSSVFFFLHVNLRFLSYVHLRSSERDTAISAIHRRVGHFRSKTGYHSQYLVQAYLRRARGYPDTLVSRII